MSPSLLACPRLIIAGLSGGSGKTLVSLGLARAFHESGQRVQPFKKGPDYIDANWLGLACQGSTSNLDPFLLSPDILRRLFWHRIQDCDLALIEGNRGLFDGKNTSGTCSTAELSRWIKCPVLLVVDCTKMTRTMAAIIQGCANFEPDVHLGGVILNRTAGERHRRILRESITKYTDVPVLGALPKIRRNPIPERHMGLTSDQEMETGRNFFPDLAAVIRDHCDLDGIGRLASSAPACENAPGSLYPAAENRDPVIIGYVRDAALWFYYRENLEALEARGARLKELSLLSSDSWPEIHGLYLGGGFPETLAERLAERSDIRKRVRNFALQGMPIYAECGGFMYLGRSLVFGDSTYPMAGVFPVTTSVCRKPQGHGYTQARVVQDNPFFAVGSLLCGHEFHYSRCHFHESEMKFALKMDLGTGMEGGKDGLVFLNTFASYNHIHALGNPDWAVGFVEAARAYRIGLDTLSGGIFEHTD